MNAAAQHTLHVLPDIVLGYGHSDEYSFVFHKSCTLFERRSAKLASTIVSTFTSAYVHLWPKHFSSHPVAGTFFCRATKGSSLDLETGDEYAKGSETTVSPTTKPHTELDISYLPTFDARCIAYPSNVNLRDYLSWRQADCHINNLYNTTFWALVLRGGISNVEAEESLKGTLSSDKNEILWSRFGVNYNNELEIFKKGSVVLRDYALVALPRYEDDSRRESSVVDTEDEIRNEKELSKTQKEKMKKARQKAKVIVEHVDVIKDEFWLRRPWLLSGKPGGLASGNE